MPAIEMLEIVVRNVTWKGASFVTTGELDNCTVAANDALDAISGLAFDGVEIMNQYNDLTATSIE